MLTQREREGECRLENEITAEKFLHANVRQAQWNDHNHFSLSISHRFSHTHLHASNSTNYSNITTHAQIRVCPLEMFNILMIISLNKLSWDRFHCQLN